jgi:uncharacterized protein with ParB-like and HNH nuclease domain
VPPFQREYSWARDEVAAFWDDLRASLDPESYFLGLVVLTDSPGRKAVIDGQQRLITLTLLGVHFEIWNDEKLNVEISRALTE